MFVRGDAVGIKTKSTNHDDGSVEVIFFDTLTRLGQIIFMKCVPTALGFSDGHI